MSNSENSREDIERSSEEILEETMREIRDDLQSSSQDDVSNASSEEDDGVIRLDDNEEFYDRAEDEEDAYLSEDDGIEEDEIELDELDEEEEESGKKRGKKKALIVLLVILGVLALAYLGMALFFTKHFFFYTKINGTEYSAETVSAVESYMEEQVEGYELTLEEIDGGTETIVGDDIDLTYVDGKEVDDLLKDQNPLLWITALWDHPDIEAPVGVRLTDRHREVHGSRQ